MELKQLSYFITVAEEGTISAAARKLNLTQPPLSAQMKLLEQECGCLLFERGSRRIQLTEAGKMLYNRARTMLELSDITRQELKDYREGTSGTLRLGAVSSVSGTLLTQMVTDFHKAHPQINFELVEANTYQLLEQLHSNLLELAIIRTPFSDQGLETFRLLDEPMLAVGHHSFFLSETSASKADTHKSTKSPLPLLPMQALDKMPLLLYRRWENVLSERFQAAGIQPYLFCKNDDARTCALWADAGLGVAILPASAMELIRNPETDVYEIDDPRLHSGICIVHAKDTWLSAIAKSFLSHFT